MSFPPLKWKEPACRGGLEGTPLGTRTCMDLRQLETARPGSWMKHHSLSWRGERLLATLPRCPQLLGQAVELH